MNYRVPLTDLRFALRVHGRLNDILALPASDGLDADTVDAVLDEAAKFAEQQLAPTNRSGDIHGAVLRDGKVHSHDSIAEAYAAFRDAGWMGLRAPAEYGGQGLPAVVAAACEEMWCASNLAFSLLPMLTLGAVEALLHHADETQKQTYLPNMCQGIWSGTMNLTEPQAGSDLGQVAAKAEPKGDGTYAVSGQKIFITWGEQELTDNIVHLVLARLPGAPAGVKGISLFIVPKYLPDAEGKPGARNRAAVVGLEHKLGIHASPTCVMQFDEAEGYLVGEAGKGLNYMFTMMNHARLGVGIEGHAVAERAYQAAVSYARERIQSRAAGGSTPVPIIRHPDVRRMLLVQKATLAAQRALYMQAAAAIDLSRHAPDEAERRRAEAELGFLIPIVKAWCTDNGTELTNLAMQVFGGAGYIEESGVAQYVRDVRITAIYEGTNGIQALDLAGRKTAADQGRTARSLLARGRQTAAELAAVLPEAAADLQLVLAQAEQSVAFMTNAEAAAEQTAAAAYPYLQQMACTLGAVAMAQNYLAAVPDDTFDADYCRAQQQLALFYFAHIMPKAQSFALQVHEYSAKVLLDFPQEAL